MTYDPKKHNRRSIRLKGYDYSQPGLYFITICVQDRLSLFGNISSGILNLSVPGQMIEKWYYELENKFPDIKCHDVVVMPNHFHAIIENTGVIGYDILPCPKSIDDEKSSGDDGEILGEHIGSPLHRVIQWFKTMTTNEYIRGVKTKNWTRFNRKLWQRNYWEHIIRDDRAYRNISQYIRDNPVKWEKDKLNLKSKKTLREPVVEYNHKNWKI